MLYNIGVVVTAIGLLVVPALAVMTLAGVPTAGYLLAVATLIETITQLAYILTK